jgi:hypothetical protein
MLIVGNNRNRLQLALLIMAIGVIACLLYWILLGKPGFDNAGIVSRINNEIVMKKEEWGMILPVLNAIQQEYKDQQVRLEFSPRMDRERFYVYEHIVNDTYGYVIHDCRVNLSPDLILLLKSLDIDDVIIKKDSFKFILHKHYSWYGEVFLKYSGNKTEENESNQEDAFNNYKLHAKTNWLYAIDSNWVVGCSGS